MKKDKLQEKLKDLGIEYNCNAQTIISKCEQWYKGKQTDFHNRQNVNGYAYTIPTVNFAKRCCADDANLCEVVEINASEDSADFKAVKDILKANRFMKMYRKQLERMSASGTVGAYVYLDNVEGITDDEGNNTITNAKVRLNFCYADNIVPITVVNDEITECAFMGSNRRNGKQEEILVVFRLDESGKYYVESYTYIDDSEDESKRAKMQLSEVKPFAIMTTAECNNFDDMEGYGYPKLYSAIPILECLDLAFYILYGDLDKGEKIVFLNEILACIRKNEHGEAYLTPEQKKFFVLLGEKLPEQESVIQEYNPVIRIEDITKVIETLLSLLSMMFGFGTKKYTFENGQIKTASEYIGERQDCMQELNKQRDVAVDYIADIIKAIKWFSNTYAKTTFEINEEIAIDFDDSYVEDKTVRIERLRTDSQIFDIPMLKVWYIMEAYNLTEEEAKAMVLGAEEAQINNETKDANEGEEE